MYVVMAVGLFAVPILATWRAWEPDELATRAAFEYQPFESALTAREVEAFATDGFDGLAAEIRSRPEAPDWEEIRQIMQRRGCTGLRYVLKVRFCYSDGSTMDHIALRHPYDEPSSFTEFLRYLRDGPAAAADEFLDPTIPPPAVRNSGGLDAARGEPRP